MTTGGDVGFSYDMQFLNTGTSYITSAGPLTIQAGSPNTPHNLTLTTAGESPTTGGDVIVDVRYSNQTSGGLKVIGADSGGFVFKVSPSGDVEIGGTGSGGSDLTVKQNLTLTGGDLTIGQLDISATGTPVTSVTTSGGSCLSLTTYYYRVTALNENGETFGSAEASQATGDSGNDEQVTVSWNPVSGATGYKLYRNAGSSIQAGATVTLVDSGTISAPTTSVTDDCSGDNASATFPIADTTGGEIKYNCPADWVWVPGSEKFGTEPGFCVMKYEAKSENSVPVSKAAGNPWINISQEAAITECRSLGQGTHLITEMEWMTIAYDAVYVDSNWSTSVGSGNLARGWAANTAYGDTWTNTAVAPSTGSSCLYNTAADACDTTGTHLYRRTFTLSNGETIWDISGNVWEWTDKIMTVDDMPEGTNSLRTGTCAVDPASIAAGTVGTAACTASGITSAAHVYLTPPTALEDGLVLEGATAGSGSITVSLLNTTAGAIDGAALTWSWLAWTPTSEWLEYTSVIRYKGMDYIKPPHKDWDSGEAMGKLYTDAGGTTGTIRAFIRGGLEQWCLRWCFRTEFEQCSHEHAQPHWLPLLSVVP